MGEDDGDDLSCHALYKTHTHTHTLPHAESHTTTNTTGHSLHLTLFALQGAVFSSHDTSICHRAYTTAFTTHTSLLSVTSICQRASENHAKL